MSAVEEGKLDDEDVQLCVKRALLCASHGARRERLCAAQIKVAERDAECRREAEEELDLRSPRAR